jgi:hypothetical protein
MLSAPTSTPSNGSSQLGALWYHRAHIGEVAQSCAASLTAVSEWGSPKAARRATSTRTAGFRVDHVVASAEPRVYSVTREQ